MFVANLTRIGRAAGKAVIGMVLSDYESHLAARKLFTSTDYPSFSHFPRENVAMNASVIAKVKVAGRIVLVAGMMASSLAHAIAINATAGFIPFGTSPTFTGASLATATSLNFASPNYINSLPGTSNGQTNVFNPANGVNWIGAVGFTAPTQVAVATLSGVNLIGASPTPTFVDALFTFASGRFVFDLKSLSKSSRGPNNLALAGTGVLRDTTGAYEDTLAAFSSDGSVTLGNQFNPSFSFTASGQVAVVPVPASLPLFLAGFALVAAASRKARGLRVV